MAEVKVSIPPGMSERVAKFELEQTLVKKQQRLHSIRNAVETLDLKQEDITAFEEARKHAWEERKEQLL